MQIPDLTAAFLGPQPLQLVSGCAYLRLVYWPSSGGNWQSSEESRESSTECGPRGVIVECRTGLAIAWGPAGAVQSSSLISQIRSSRRVLFLCSPPLPPCLASTQCKRISQLCPSLASLSNYPQLHDTSPDDEPGPVAPAGMTWLFLDWRKKPKVAADKIHLYRCVCVSVCRLTYQINGYLSYLFVKIFQVPSENISIRYPF